MDIKSLLEEYAVIMDDMEAESGLNTVIEPEKKKEEKNESVNEEKDLAEKPADMEQAEYKDMTIKKPEVDTVASKLLKQCEELEESWEPYEVFFDKDEQKYFIAKDTGMDYNEWRNGDTDEIIYYDTEEEAQKDCDEINKEFEQVNADESLTEEFKGEDFKHYSKFNKCKDVKEIKDLIKTIRDDIKDEDDKDKKAELKDDLAKAKNLLKMAQDLKKNESKINEVDLETAQKVNDIRNKDAVLNQDDEEAQEKAEKSNKLFRKWKKAKGIEEAVESLGELKTKKTNKK